MNNIPPQPVALDETEPAKDPKRLGSSTTRRGNGVGKGVGWGGPAKGAGKPAPKHADFEPGNQAAAKPAKT